MVGVKGWLAGKFGAQPLSVSLTVKPYFLHIPIPSSTFSRLKNWQFTHLFRFFMGLALLLAWDLCQVPVPWVAVSVVHDVVEYVGRLHLLGVDLVPIAPEIMDEIGLCGVFLILDEDGPIPVFYDCAVLFHSGLLSGAWLLSLCD